LDVEPAGQFAQTSRLVVSVEFAPLNAYLPAGHAIDPEQDEVISPPLPNVPEGQIVQDEPV
jgi:hypothetical protein